MANSYYTHTAYPATNGAGSSSAMRAELDAIMAGFALLPNPLGPGQQGFTGGTWLNPSLTNPSFAGGTYVNGTYTGGAIDGVTIGGVTPAAAHFTTLAASAGGALAGTFTGSPTFSGAVSFTGSAAFSAGGTLAGNFSGSPTFSGAVTFTSSVAFGAGGALAGTFTGSPAFSGAVSFTGSVTAPTPTAGDSSSLVPTTAFVQTALNALGSNSQFASLRSTFTGYQKLPGGVIIQWGRVFANSSGVATFTLPITFPNQLVSISASYIFDGVSYGVVAQASNASTNSALVANAFWSSNGAPMPSANVYFIAIGW